MKEFIEGTFNSQIRDLQRLVSVRSVSRGEPAMPGKPFGKSVDEALQTALNIARNLGFENVRNLDGYAGVIEYGEGEETLGILAHLDVVPAGEGWTYPPFGAQLHGGRIYGRGTLDDKGAAVSAMYALAAVKESGVRMRRKVRIILGTDEEIGSLGVAHYLKVEGPPTLAFTPDAEYPVVNSEMGILQATYRREGTYGIRVSVGTAANVIPGVVTATLPVPAKETLIPDGFTACFAGNTVTVTGRGGHASMPSFAKNALQAMLQVLREQELPEPDASLVNGLSSLWAMDLHGERFGIDVSDESGRTTYSPDMFTVDETGATFTCDCRHPFSLQAEDLLKTAELSIRAYTFKLLETSRTRKGGVKALSPRASSSCLRRSSSSSGSRTRMERAGMSISMRSPSRTRPMAPPAAASGEMCPMDRPEVPPLKRPSVSKAHSLPRCTDFK